MSRSLHRLKDSELRAAIGSKKTLHDGGGLYFQTTGTGAASFHYRYQIGKRVTKMGLGPYPTLSLADARERHKYFQKVKALGRDPKLVRDEERAEGTRSYRSISQIFDEFFLGYQRKLKNSGDAGRWWSPVKVHVLPKLGDETVETLNTEKVVAAFAPIWTTKKDTARKAFNRLRMALEFARVDEPFDLQVLSDAVAKLGPQGKHKRVSARALHWNEWPNVYAGLTHSMTHTALKLMVLTVVRTANIRFMRWEQIDRRQAVWTLTDADTKSEQPFRVPLPYQAIALLKHAERWKDETGFVFTVPSNKSAVLSENAFLQYFNKNGINTTGHGIRSTVTDYLRENDIANQELADMALAHQTKKEVTAAYFRSDMLEKRRAIMQQWADFVTNKQITKQFAFEQDRQVERYIKSLQAMDSDDLALTEAGLRSNRVDKWYRQDQTKIDFLDEE